MSLCGTAILRILYLQMMAVRVCLYFYTSSVVHVTFAVVVIVLV